MKPVQIIKDIKYQDMYRLEWEDGIPSADMYNLTRAYDILLHYDQYVFNTKRQKV